MVLVTERNKIETLLRELLDARRNRKSEQPSVDQLNLFAAAWQARQAEAEMPETSGGSDDDDAATPGAGDAAQKKRSGGRQPLARHLKSERIVHDLTEEEKHCAARQHDLRPIGEEPSERYEYIPAQLTVIEDGCKKYACDCTVKTATKPPQPIEKSTAGASLLAQVIVAKTADHLPLHRQEKVFERHGVDISRKTMGGWLAQCADLLHPLIWISQGRSVPVESDRNRRCQRESAEHKASFRAPVVSGPPFRTRSWGPSALTLWMRSSAVSSETLPKRATARGPGG